MCDHDHSHGDCDEELLEATKSGDSRCVRALIQAGADVNSRSKYRKTACMLAAQYGHAHCVDVLIQEGADVNVHGLYGKTALLLAVETGQDECVQKLLEAGADVNVCTTVGQIRGKSVLMYAASRGYAKYVNVLIQAGADVNHCSKNNLTAFIMAACNCQNECMRILVESGADVNHTDDYGNTALMLLAVQNHHRGWFEWPNRSEDDIVKTIGLLLKLGAHVNKVDNLGIKPLMRLLLTAFQPKRKLVTLLFAAGETIDGTPVAQEAAKRQVDEILGIQHKEIKLCLKHMCREAIRKHLISLNKHAHLFGRIPQLGLPSLVTNYLLYDISLEAE